MTQPPKEGLEATPQTNEIDWSFDASPEGEPPPPLRDRAPLDAEWDFDPMSLLASDDIEALSVFGEDSRVAASVDDAPWRAVCRIDVRGPAGVSFGSGFVVAPSWVLTAAHVFTEVGGPKLQVVVVFPDGRQCRANFFFYPDFASTRLPGHDLALVQLPRGFAGNLSGNIRLYPFPDPFLEQYRRDRSPSVAAGYPMDWKRTLVFGNGPVVGFDPITILHEADARVGESGGPLLYLSPRGAAALGVHAYGDINDRVPPRVPNKAARITKPVLDWISSLVHQFGA